MRNKILFSLVFCALGISRAGHLDLFVQAPRPLETGIGFEQGNFRVEVGTGYSTSFTDDRAASSLDPASTSSQSYQNLRSAIGFQILHEEYAFPILVHHSFQISEYETESGTSKSTSSMFSNGIGLELGAVKTISERISLGARFPVLELSFPYSKNRFSNGSGSTTSSRSHSKNLTYGMMPSLFLSLRLF